MASDLQDVLLDELTQLLEPLVRAAREEFEQPRLFAAIGWQIDLIPGLPMAEMQQALSAVATANDAVRQLDPPNTLEELRDWLQALTATVTAAQRLSTLLDQPGMIRPPQFDRVAQEIIGYLTARHLFVYHPVAYALCELLTLVTQPPTSSRPPVIDPTSGRTVREPATYPTFWPDRVPDLLNKPLELLTNEYIPVGGMADDTAAIAVATKLFPRLATVLETLGLQATFGPAPDTAIPVIDPSATSIATHALTVSVPAELGLADTTARGGVRLTLSPQSRGDLGFVFSPFGELAFTELYTRWNIVTEVTAGVEGFAVGPRGFLLRAVPGTAKLSARADVITIPAAAGGPALVIGARSGSRVEIGNLRLGAGASLSIDRTDIELMLDASDTLVVIAAGDGDGFLQRVLPRELLRIPFDLGVGWSKEKGFYFRGSAGLDATFALGIDIAGLVKIEQLHLLVRASTSGAEALIGTTVGVQLGPISAVVERIGLRVVLTFPAQGGNFGSAHVDLMFNPPRGAALAVDAGVVVGGGFISLNHEKGQYAGILHLRAGEIAIKAIGLINTKLPGGKEGYSFLLIVTGEFPPIQLGFGFTLNGVGGLAGIHRSMVIEALQAGVRSHSVDHILFPENPVRDAPQIISDLSAIFPPAEGHYVFGPMVKLGYGTPTLIEAELGILLELPDPVRLVLLGQLHASLPTKEEAVVELHLDVLGVLDFGQKTLAIDAVLHDSRLAAFDLYGDMALRLEWGNQPLFALSVGGFHPAFQPPPAFPSLRRLTLALGDGGNPRLTLQTYLALTSNTLQFGALAELYAEAQGFSVSAWLGLDVLVVISPFSLLAELNASAALRRDKMLIASVTLAATLTGPTPWHLWGRATLDSIIDITVPFDVAIGPEVEETLPDVDPWSLLAPALADARNWSATLPPAGSRVVSLAPPPPGVNETLLEPLGGATVRQRVVPLNHTITKFGEAKPLGPDRYTVSGVAVGNKAPILLPMVQEFFAPAQFEELSDAEKLSRPSFERMDAGLTIASDAVAIGTALGTDVVFSTIIVDQPNLSPSEYRMPESQQFAALARSASARAPLASIGNERFSPPPTAKPLVSLADESFQIVDAEDLSQLPIDGAASKGEAYRKLAARVRSNPGWRGRLDVIPSRELAA